MQIFRYPKELPNFFGTRIRLSLLPTLPELDFLLPELFDTRSTTNQQAEKHSTQHITELITFL